MQHILLTIDPGPESDVEELALLTQQLRSNLLQLDVENVELADGGAPPPGSKAGNIVNWGTLFITLAGSQAMLPALVGAVQSWLVRNEKRSIVLDINGEKLEIVGATSEQQQQLITHWIEWHGKIDR